jgi:hypothetical protein
MDESGNRDSKRARTVLAFLTVVLFAAIAALLAHRNNIAFDAELWRSSLSRLDAQRPDGQPRKRMVRSLLASPRLDGMSRGQVIALLGLPNSMETAEGAPEGDLARAYRYRYFLGAPSFRVFSPGDTQFTFLVIEFSEKGTADRRYLVDD